MSPFVGSAGSHQLEPYAFLVEPFALEKDMNHFSLLVALVEEFPS